MSKRKLVITAITQMGLSQAEAARRYEVPEPTISRWMARYRAEGPAAFEPRSRRPKSNPAATPPAVIEAILAERDRLTVSGHDAGPETISWHLQQTRTAAPSRATIARILSRAGRVRPEPKKKPKAAYRRFEAEQPNQCWQSDFTHYLLATGVDVEIITWLDDHSRMALHVSAHHAVTGRVVLDTFRATIDEYGCPASTLTDNGMVYTVRHSSTGVRGGKNAFERALADLGITQKNGRGNHPQTQGKVERFQLTLKKWLRAQPEQPATITDLQALLDQFRHEYNHERPHRSLARRTPAAAYAARPVARPSSEPADRTHNRVRTDKVNEGTVTLRHGGRLHHIGLGRAWNGTPVLLLIQDLEITAIHAETGELIRELTLDPTKDYQPQKRQDPNPQ